MKNSIYVNYGYKIEKIYHDFFFINDEKIIIKKVDDLNQLNNLVNLTNEMFKQGKLVHTFLISKNGKYYFEKDNEYICLLKVNDREDCVSYDLLKDYCNINMNMKEFDIINHWKKQIDGIEEKIIEYNKEHQLIRNSINYYIGLGENAIQLLKKNNESCNDIGHMINVTEFDRYYINNPFTFIKINKMYDVSNYIKNSFFENNLNYDELDIIIGSINNDYEKIFLYASLLFPNYYFEIVEKIFNSKADDKKLGKYIELIPEYEFLLVYCKSKLNNVSSIKKIDWFK